MFGAPVVWNPILMIPLCLNSIIIPSLMYLVMRIGLVPIPSAPMQMWYLPNIVQGYLTTNSMSGVILVIALFAVSWLIWMPFFRVFEKQQYKEELENRKERGDHMKLENAQAAMQIILHAGDARLKTAEALKSLKNL